MGAVAYVYVRITCNEWVIAVCGMDVYVVPMNFYVPVGFIYLGAGMFVVITVLSLTGVLDVERREHVFDSQYR